VVLSKLGGNDLDIAVVATTQQGFDLQQWFGGLPSGRG
jgi:hypothetical protein